MHTYMDKYGNSKWNINDIDVSTTNMHTSMDKYGNSKWCINDIDVLAAASKYIYMDKYGNSKWSIDIVVSTRSTNILTNKDI